MSYPGGKGGDGVYQRLISMIPPHEVYIEGCLGGGAILKHKQPARVSLAFDLDTAALDGFDQGGLPVLEGPGLPGALAKTALAITKGEA